MIISKFIKKMIYLFTAGISLLLLILNLVYINNIDNAEISNIEQYKIKYLLISIFLIIAIIFFSYFVNKIEILHKYKKRLIILLFILYGIVQLIWVIKSIAIPFADSEQVLIISRGFLGKEEMIEYCYRYLEYYPQQITLSAIFSVIYVITNTTDYVVIQYINIIFNIISMIGIYAIACIFSKKYSINKILFFVLVFTFIPIILLSTFIYGDLIGLPFAVWSVYFAIKKIEKENIKYAIISAILIAISCLTRMNYVIFAIAIAIYWIINILDIDKKNFKSLFKEISILIVFALCIVIPNNIIKNIFKKNLNLSSEREFSTTPYIYMGMSEGDRGVGWYNNDIGEIVYHLMCDEEELVKEVRLRCKDNLNKRIDFFIQNPRYTFNFYIKKVITMWAEPTNEYAYYNSSYKENININEYPLIKSINHGRLKEVEKIYQKGIILLIFAGTTYVAILKFKKIDKELLLLMTVFIGGFLFHLLWEAKSRYIIPYIIILIPIASIGITEITEKIINIVKRRKNA